MAPDAAQPESSARIGVIIPVYNGAQTIGATIESVLAQSYRDFEVIVIDDGSTDATRSILACFGSRITVLKQSNKGFCAARNAGIALCKSDLIALLDADDLWLPTKLEKSLAVITQSPEIALVYTNVINQDSEGRDLGT